MSNRYTYEWCAEYARSKGGEILSPEFLGPKVRHKYRCSEGHEFEARPVAHKYKHSWCPACYADVAHDIRIPQNIAKQRGGMLISTVYTNIREKLLWQCHSGHQWRATFHNVLHRESWCPECANESRRIKAKQRAIGKISAAIVTIRAIEATDSKTLQETAKVGM